MKTKRAPRFERKPQEVGGLRLQERDIEIIRLVNDHRFLNSGHIKLLTDSSDKAILRRLQKLFHHGFLDRPLYQLVYPLKGTQKMIYALGDRGADLLAEKFGIDRGRIKWNEKNKEVKDRHIQHTLMISDFRVCLQLALKNVPGTSILFWQKENPQELKDHVYIEDSQGRRRKAPIVPDGFFGVQSLKGKAYFFLEADQSTMDNARFLRKMKAYWVWGMKEKRHTKRFGIKAFRVLTITKSEQRKENLRRITQRADDKQRGSPMFWFATEKKYSIQNPESILEAIWQTPEDDEFHSILE